MQFYLSNFILGEIFDKSNLNSNIFTHMTVSYETTFPSISPSWPLLVQWWPSASPPPAGAKTTPVPVLSVRSNFAPGRGPHVQGHLIVLSPAWQFSLLFFCVLHLSTLQLWRSQWPGGGDPASHYSSEGKTQCSKLLGRFELIFLKTVSCCIIKRFAC